MFINIQLNLTGTYDCILFLSYWKNELKRQIPIRAAELSTGERSKEEASSPGQSTTLDMTHEYYLGPEDATTSITVMHPEGKGESRNSH